MIQGPFNQPWVAFKGSRATFSPVVSPSSKPQTPACIETQQRFSSGNPEVDDMTNVFKRLDCSMPLSSFSELATLKIEPPLFYKSSADYFSFMKAFLDELIDQLKADPSRKLIFLFCCT